MSSSRKPIRRAGIALAAAAATLVAATYSPATGQPTPTDPPSPTAGARPGQSQSESKGRQDGLHGHNAPEFVRPERRNAKPGPKLPVKSGSVPLDESLTLVGDSAATEPPTAETPGTPDSATEPETPGTPDSATEPETPTDPAAPSDPAAPEPTEPGTSSGPDATPGTTPGTTPDATPGATPAVMAASQDRVALATETGRTVNAAVTPSTRNVALRALVITVDSADYGLPTWKATLDRVGAQYDVLETRSQPLTAETLVQADGTGRYNAILLTDGMQLYNEGGTFVSGLSDEEWNTLWAYERDFGVRQATLYSSYGSWPEDYCLRAGSEGGVGDNAITASLTARGAAVFDYLKGSAKIPISQSYVYRDSVAQGCAAEPVLTTGSSVLGVTSESTDGRERMALTFTSNQYLIQADLLVFGLFRWATRGLYFGEQRHFLNVDVDDWFNSTDQRLPDGTINSDPGFRMSAHDAYQTSELQKALRRSFPLANAFKLNLAYNAGDADLSAGSRCWPSGGVDRLTATSRCLKNEFSWINHTFTHPKMNFTDYPTSYSEIKQGFDVARDRLGFTVPGEVVKTGEYSGLGVYHPDVNNDVDPPTDYGINASNADLLAAAKALGVKYLHGNMSFKSHLPECFNCGVIHPMEPSITVVPDWPTNIAYFATTPAEETSFYNSFYGPNGKFAYWPTDRTYAQVIDYEAQVALSHVASGSIYAHTMHIGNLRDYGGGKNLVFDWANAVVSKYNSYYNVPLLTPNWLNLANYVADRNRHFDLVKQGVTGVYDPVANTVTVSSTAAGKVTVSGAQGSGSTTYGNDVSTPVTLTANSSVTAPARRLP